MVQVLFCSSYMLRGLILLLLGAGLTILALPFVMTSRAMDEHGIAITGHLYHKSETIKTVYSSWERAYDATIEYPVPETGGVSFFTIHPDAQQYDGLHPQQAVEVRYLLRRDVPELPLAKFLWEIHALPTVRAMNLQETSKLKALLTPANVLVFKVLGGVAGLLVLWRLTRWGPLAWAAGIGVVAFLGLLYLQGFPRPTPAPSVAVRRASALVKSIGHIDKLFSGTHQRGTIADLPMDVVGMEFVPEGRTEPVVAVDLIDRGSVAGLKEQSTVAIQYEGNSPRTAYIEGATRTFPQRNFSGLILQGVLCIAVLIGMFAVARWIGRAFNRLTARKGQS